MVVQELIAKLGFEVDQTNLNKAENSLASMAKSAGLIYGAYRLAGEAVGLVVDSVKRAANLESMNAEFEVMLGNAEAARYLVQQINQFAAVTPFETAGLVGNVKLMMAFGQSANQAMAAVKMLGDVAGADQERLNRLALAYAQVFAAGKMQGQDLLQFINAGFNPLQELSKSTGKSMGTLRKEMEKGLITAEMVQEAFARATGEGGRFFGNMEKQSTTLNGLWATMMDNLKMTSAELGGEMVPFIKAVLVAFIELTPAIGDAFRQLSDFFGIMLSDGITAEDVASGIAASFMTAADSVMLLGTFLMLVKSAVEGLQAGLFGFFGFLTALPSAILVVPMRIFGWILDKIAALASKISFLRGMVPFLADQSRSIKEGADTVATPANTLGYMAQDYAASSGKSWDKFMEMGAMIGGSKPEAPGSKVKLDDKILAALEGKTKIVNNNVEVNNNIYADGALKDILEEQANDIIGLGFQTRLIASLS